MKTSNILFILTLVIGFIAIRFFESWGNVKMTADNQPANTLSKLWLKIYDTKVTQELPKPIKYVKLMGSGQRIYLEMQQHKDPHLFSPNPQTFTYTFTGDTLVIQAIGNFAHIVLKQPVPGEHVALHHVKASVVGFSQDKFTIHAHDESSLLPDLFNRDSRDSVGHLYVYATDRSLVDLHHLRANHVSSTMENAVLNYGSETKADSVAVTLRGRSTVRSKNKDAVNQIGQLTVSGNKEYFNQEFAGKGVDVVMPN